MARSLVGLELPDGWISTVKTMHVKPRPLLFLLYILLFLYIIAFRGVVNHTRFM